MEFTATEAGFDGKLGGASNSSGDEEPHYIVFGHQRDDQHPETSGAYFEFDDQINGSVDGIKRIRVGDLQVEFVLKDRRKVVVRFGVDDSTWNEFLSGIREVFVTVIAS